MTDFRKLQDYRIDLQEIMAFSVHKLDLQDYNKIKLYPKSRPKDYIEIYYSQSSEDKLFEEASKMLDDYFGVKTEAEYKLLP